ADPRKNPASTSLAFVVFVCILLIGASRIYLGVHFPSDVLAGFFLGSATVVFVGTIAQNMSQLMDVRRRSDIAGVAVISAGFLAAGIYNFYWDPTPPPRQEAVLRENTTGPDETTDTI